MFVYEHPAGDLFDFAALGLTSFGGPIAHLGYFERTYVKEKCWLTHEEYSHMVALCQLLPGPASSQVNFLVGLRRSGWPGALSYWAGFTLPSALLLYAFAVLAPKVHGPLVCGFAGASARPRGANHPLSAPKRHGPLLRYSSYSCPGSLFWPPSCPAGWCHLRISLIARARWRA